MSNQYYYDPDEQDDADEPQFEATWYDERLGRECVELFYTEAAAAAFVKANPWLNARY